MILRMYENWQNAPVIVSFATKPTSIYDIPFPAVTICPETKTSKMYINYTELRTIKKKSNNGTLSEEQWVAIASQD